MFPVAKLHSWSSAMHLNLAKDSKVLLCFNPNAIPVLLLCLFNQEGSQLTRSQRSY